MPQDKGFDTFTPPIPLPVSVGPRGVWMQTGAVLGAGDEPLVIVGFTLAGRPLAFTLTLEDAELLRDTLAGSVAKLKAVRDGRN